MTEPHPDAHLQAGRFVPKDGGVRPYNKQKVAECDRLSRDSMSMCAHACSTLTRMLQPSFGSHLYTADSSPRRPAPAPQATRGRCSWPPRLTAA